MSVGINESRSHEGTISVNHLVWLNLIFGDIRTYLLDLPSGYVEVNIVVSHKLILRVEADDPVDVSYLKNLSETSLLDTLVYIIKSSHLFNNKML